MREALFSIWRRRIDGARFLDLFAGSGAVGLEALSRGAVEVRFVEARARAVNVIRGNAVRLAQSGWDVLRAELPGGLGRLGASRFDLAFADPPYDFDRYEEVIAEAVGVLESPGELAVEHSVRVALPREVAGLTLRDQKVYGESALTLYECSTT